MNEKLGSQVVTLVPINSQRNAHSFIHSFFMEKIAGNEDRTAQTSHTVSDSGYVGEVEINHIVWWMQFEPQ